MFRTCLEMGIIFADLFGATRKIFLKLRHFGVEIALLFNRFSSFCLVFFQDKHAEEVRKNKEHMELDWQ